MGFALSLIIIILIILWRYFKTVYGYWSRRGVVGPKPWPIFGNYGPCIWGNLHEYELLFKIYHQYPNEKCVGVFKGMTPVLLLRDPLLVKQAFENKDATFFRRIEAMEGITEQHLGGSNYEVWKLKRKNLSMLFSNSNLDKNMSLINDCVEKHQAEISETFKKANEVEISKIFKKFYSHVIYQMCLGVAYKDLPVGSELEQLKRKIVPKARYSKLFTITTTFPLLAWPTKQLIEIHKKTFKTKVNNILKETKVLSQDIDSFAGLVVYLMKFKILNAKPTEEIIKNIDEDFIVQNIFTMLHSLQGLVNNVSNAIFELAHDHEAQEKAYKEIKRVLKKNDEKLSVKSVFDMSYLLEIQEEALRHISKSTFIFRKCKMEFKLYGQAFHIDQKAEICAPSSAIVNDPQHFEDSQSFKPERYSADNLRKMKHDGTDLTFGIGPRMCIARRFTKFMVTIGLIMYLRNYKFEPSSLTKHRLKLDEEEYMEPKQHKIPKYNRTEYWVKIERRESDILGGIFKFY